MDLTNLMLSGEGLSVLLWEFLPHPDQQRLACTCKSLAKQYAKPTLEPLKKRSEELFLLQLVSGEKEGEMFDYVRKGNYECRWITNADGAEPVSTFGTLREALEGLLLDHVETIDQEPEEFWAWCHAKNLVEKGRDNGEDGGAAAESGNKDGDDEEEKNEEETEPRPTKRQRRQPLLVCSSAFCVQTKNGEPVDDLHCLEPGHRAFCMGCLQLDWRLRYQFYRHHEYSHGWNHASWEWSEASAGDSDNEEEEETTRDDSGNNNWEYWMRFYYGMDVGCGGCYEDEFVFVGNPCSTADQSNNNKSGSSG